MKKIWIILGLISLSISLMACEKESHLIAVASNETITDTLKLESLLLEAETYYFKDYYFYDLRDHALFALGFVGGFKNVDPETLATSFKDKNKYSMIVLFSASTENTIYYANILMEMGFYNVKIIDLTFTTIYDNLQDRILIVDENGNSCPIIPDPEPGC